MSEWHQTFVRLLKRASRPDGRCTVKCMLLQKGAVNYCGCISGIEGAYIRIVGESAPTKRYKITPLVPELSEHAVFRDFRHCAETADVVVSKIFRITHQESKLNVTLSPSQHIIPFSH